MKQLMSDELFRKPEFPAVSFQKTEESNGIHPYWNPFVRDVSGILWLPPSGFSDESDITIGNSWFSALMKEAANPGISAACLSLFSDCSDSGGLKSKKIRIYPDDRQKSLLRQWLGTARFVFNQTVAYLKQPETSANWFGIKTEIIAGLPEWAKSVPYQIKSVAVRDACDAVKNAKMKCRKTGQIQDVKFRSKREKKDSVYILKQLVKTESFYVRYLGKKIRMTETMPEVLHDCRLKCENGKFWLCIPVAKADLTPENQRCGAAGD